MSWDEVPEKLVQYALEPYAPFHADTKLLEEFGVKNVADVPEEMQLEFEHVLDYRLGACINLKSSTAMRTFL